MSDETLYICPIYFFRCVVMSSGMHPCLVRMIPYQASGVLTFFLTHAHELNNSLFASLYRYITGYISNNKLKLFLKLFSWISSFCM